MTIFRCEVFTLVIFLSLTGCIKREPISCNSSVTTKPIADVEKSKSIVGVIWTRKLRNEVLDANFGSGFGAETVSKIGATSASKVVHTVQLLKSRIADAKAVDLWLASSGAVSFESNSSEICETLAVSVSNLAVGQSDDQFLDSVKTAENYFVRRYESFGGVQLEKEISKLDY